MPKSSRHKSHKQSKHSSKDLLSESEEDVKLKERNNTREVAASGRVSIESSHLSSGEKMKLSSLFQSKEGKDLSYSEENVSSKVRKEKVERITGSGDRWTAGGDEVNGSRAVEKEMGGHSLKPDVEKGLKSRESKGSSVLKSKSSKRHESGVEEDRDVASVFKGKEEENKSVSTRCDSKRKSDKDSCRREGRESRDTKEKELVPDRDSKKIQERKQESEARVNVGIVTKKRDSLSEDADKDKLVKRGKEDSELGIPESGKELEKRVQRKVEGSGDRDVYEEGRENEYKKVPSKGDAGKYKDERYKAGNHREKYQDDIKKNDDHRDDKYREHVGRDRDNRRRDDKYRDGGEREHRHRDDVDWDFKHRKDDGGDAQLKVDKYREDNNRENKHRDDKYLEGGKDNRRESRYYEDVGLKDEKHRGKNDRHKEEKRREDHEKDNEIRDGRHGDKFDNEKRVREAKYKDDHALRDRSGDKSAATNLREDTLSSELLSRKSGVHDNSPSYDERSRLKGAQGRKRTSDKDDYIDLKPRGFKDQRYDVEKRSSSDARVELFTDRGRSGSRYADVEATSIRNRLSPSSSSHATRDQYRVIKQEDMKYREYGYEERVEQRMSSSTKEYGNEKNPLSRSIDVIPKDDNIVGEVSGERRMKSETGQLIPPSPTSGDRRRHYGRSDFRPSNDVEEESAAAGHRSGGSFNEMKSYSHKEDENVLSVTSQPYPRNSSNLSSNNSRSFSHPFHSPFRSGTDRHHIRRNGDPNMVVRAQGSPWKGLPNWPSSSPLGNGFMPPFPHGPPPPPVAFHPSMQLFPGMRPSMELNHHHHHPYPIPDNARHMGMAWRTPVYDPRPPPPSQLNGCWEANDGGESRFFVREHWHHGGPQGSKPVALPPGFEKDVHSLECPMPPSQSNEESKKDEQTTHRSDDASQTSDIVKEKIPVALEQVSEDVSKMSEKIDELICHVYLSMLDVSGDLADPELYSRYKDMVDEKVVSDSKDDNIFYVEVSKDKVKKSTSDSLFPTIGDSLVQKAMSLYNKHREGGFMMKEKHSQTTEKVKTAIEGIHPDCIDDVKNEPVVIVNNNSEEKLNGIIENTVSMETGESPCRTQVIGSLNNSEISEEGILGVTENISLKMMNVDSNKGKEVEDLSIESVKLSRIHHSPPQTTH